MNLRRRRRPSPVIPIVALVDILVIVLLFIVATTTFRSRETQMPVKLPTAENLGKSVSAQNTQKSLIVTKEKKIFLDGQEVAAGDLVSALKELKMTDPNVKLKVTVDREAPHGMYVSALDALVSAGLVKDVTTLLQRAVEGANAK